MFKENDFVQIEYTGKIKDGNEVFDTTDEKIAKEKNIYNEEYEYGPIIIALGKNQILEGLEKKIIGKKPGEYTFELMPDEAFGKKSAKLIKLVPLKAFKKDEIMPMPGLQVNIDGHLGTIRSVSGGRVLVDFNHPLSGQKLVYEIKVLKKITDSSEKVKAVLKREFYIKDIDVSVEKDKATINKDFPSEISDEIAKKIKEYIPDIKKVQFVKPEQKPKKTGTNEKHKEL